MADHAPQQDSEVQYHPKDAVAGSLKAAGVTGAAGAFISTIQNVLTKQNYGAWGAVTKFGGTTGLFVAMGGAYEFTKCASANLREKDDAYNPAIGGFFAGTMMGLRFRSLPAIAGYGTGLAALLYAFSFTGGRLSGYQRDPEVDEVTRKEYLRKNRRRPVEDTVNELGEGRGVYAPGYEERRAQRIKDAYGVDVPLRSQAS
ncbi:hypothetical protein LTR62_002586 [Meristemomyces frigidus]|uniref:NADH-ubiquinone oxidoreductase 213 kDa subunit n=1 Tax=Meristemomyces frigidus TaxID=1508187 RepID=A0AAN7YS47_9PEZI|nr:hypothetical protein LTR62_002586 [Meristemomyces frigidus]